MDWAANIYTIESLHKCLQSQDNIVIYGAGEYGRKLIDYFMSINEIRKIRGIVVTETKETLKEYRGIPTYKADSFLKKNPGGLVIIATSLMYQDDIIKIVVQYTEKYRCITPEVYSDICKKMKLKDNISYQGLDFLCAGFCKCGTTSLYSALKGIDDIYLSDLKESMFFDWYQNVENPQNILIEKHFKNIDRGQLVGMIEPTFCTHADEIFRFFGNKLKILFLVRNPVNAVFSDFKMENREGMAKLEGAYQNEIKYYEGMFDGFFGRITNEEEALVWEYTHWIKKFEKYYTQENMKVVFLEELIKNPKKELNAILQFIGSKGQYDCESLLLENKGDFVMADESGYSIAKLRSEWACKNPQLSTEEMRKRKYEERQQYDYINQQYEQAKKLYNVRMTANQKMKVQAYFNESVRELERLTEKNLTELWY